MTYKLAIPHEVIETSWQIYNAIPDREFPYDDWVIVLDNWGNEYDVNLWVEEGHHHMTIYPSFDGLTDTSQFIRLK